VIHAAKADYYDKHRHNTASNKRSTPIVPSYQPFQRAQVH
jgi:hypothetical protein